ncbi:deoxyribose-phosphate aldolase [Dysgonomonas sp. 25]|uniref:deoxyribose-phosphate aldolase n=1 Tax=Dysgonomonas sp. 25 TaxID=2302933 RepID=UPI0013D00E10|nr:deoxyribose-phosphate aldolase [Dysgonomonas sp. 25]NDV69418.1 deoxyribose-phosphate aldolase [Dysgonomonas sp. 25]
MSELSKYEQVLNEYQTNLNDSDIAAKVKKIIDQQFAGNNTKEVYKKLYSCIDYTSLNSTDTHESIWQMTEKINSFDGTTDVSNVAAICVYPNLVRTVKEALTSDVRIACVAGGFPSSQTFTEVKVAEAALAIAEGADEIDIVLSLNYFFDENYEELCEEIMEIKHTCRDARLKVILETGALKTADNIRKATLLALYSGADFVKTSTGKGYEGATLEAAYVICSTIKEYTERTGNKAGFKASGGIRTTKDAVEYYTLVKELMGEEYMTPEYFRIGASSLAENLLAEIE